MDVPGFWIADIKSLIAAVAVSFTCQIMMKYDKIIHEARLEPLDVWPVSLASDEFLPSRQQIF